MTSLMNPQDLADRLEKAYRLGDSVIVITIAHRYGVRVPSEDYKTLIAALRSASASGEMGEAVSLASDNPRGLIGEVMDELWSECGGSHQSVEFWEDASNIAKITIEFLRARTPSGETREEVGS